jgi:hypothetical protein
MKIYIPLILMTIILSSCTYQSSISPNEVQSTTTSVGTPVSTGTVSTGSQASTTSGTR